MRKMISYLCDGRTPTDGEIRECIEIAKNEHIVVKLEWFFLTAVGIKLMYLKLPHLRKLNQNFLIVTGYKI